MMGGIDAGMKAVTKVLRGTESDCHVTYEWVMNVICEFVTEEQVTGGIDAGMKERDDTVQVITYELFMSHI